MLKVVGKPPLPPNRTASRQNSTVSSTETETESEEASSNNNDKSESEPSEKEQTTKSAANAAASTTTQQKSTGEQNYTQPTHIMTHVKWVVFFIPVQFENQQFYIEFKISENQQIIFD